MALWELIVFHSQLPFPRGSRTAGGDGVPLWPLHMQFYLQLARGPGLGTLWFIADAEKSAEADFLGV